MLQPESIALLQNYQLASSSLSQRSGNERKRQAGHSVEFRDYRKYQMGDEPKHVDWKVYARTGKLYTKVFEAERNKAVYILLDSSASMLVGDKFALAQTLAKILLLAARASDSIRFMSFADSQGTVLRQQAEIMNFLSAVDALEVAPDDKQQVGQSIITTLRSLNHTGGLLVVISDLFDPNDLASSLNAIRSKGLDASFIHLLALEDIRPPSGQYELEDIEYRHKRQVDAEEVKTYYQVVQDYIHRLRGMVMARGFRYACIEANNTGEKDALQHLLCQGMLQRS